MSEKIDFSTRRVMAIVMALLISIAPAATTIVAYADDEATPVIEESSDLEKSEENELPQDTEETLEESKSEVEEVTKDNNVPEEPEQKDVKEDKGVTTDTDTEKESTVKPEDEEKTTFEENKADDTIKSEETKPLMTAALLNSEEEQSAIETDFDFADGVITAYTGSDTDVVIPETIGGVAVTTIDSMAFSSYTIDASITSIVIPKSVTIIKDCAFFACEDLKSIRFEGKCPTIEDGAFGDVSDKECSNFVNDATFYCHFKYWDKFNNSLKKYIYSTNKSIQNSIKAIPSPDTDFDFEDGVIKKYIGKDADVVIPETIGGVAVTEIATEAFSSVETVTIPPSITKICENAFDSIEKVMFDGQVTSFDEFPFGEFTYDIQFLCHKTDLSNYENKLKYYLGTEGYGADIEPIEIDTEDAKATPVYEYESVGENGYKIKSFKFVYDKDINQQPQDIVIPDTYQSKPIVAIGNNAFEVNGVSSITSITMPDTITSIGDWAFNKCINMQTIKLSSNLETIGEHAFQYCNALTEINVPQTVTEIKDLAFTMCEKLKNINVADGNAKYKDIDGVLFDKDGKVLINYPGGRTATVYKVPDGTEIIHADAFKLSPNVKENALKSVEFPSTLKEIGSRAFMQTKLESINIVPGIKMGDYVYDQCKNAKTAVVQEGVTKIEEGMLYALEGCETIKLPSTLKEIGYRAFDRLGVTNIELPEGLEVIGQEAFECSKLTSITIPSTVKTIGPRAFYLSKDLKEINFNKDSVIKSIGAYAFNQCKGLETVNLPNGVTTLEDGAFSHCYSLKSINLPDSLTTLENVVFAGSVIESITLPDGIKNIGNGTFRDCSNLVTVKMPANLETLGTCTFENCQKLTTATFPDSIKLSYLPQDTFFNCSIIEHIYLPNSIKETRACAFSNCKNNPVIEHANKNLKRSLFDCFSIDLGEYSGYYEVVDSEKGIYKLTSDIPESNEADFDKLEQVSKETDGENGSVVKSRSASGQEALCGCGGSANAVFSPTCTPTFKYKPATSGEATIPSTSSSRSRHHSYSNNGVAEPVTVAENNVEVPQTEIVAPPVIVNAEEKIATQNITPNIAPEVAQAPNLQVVTESNEVLNNADNVTESANPSIATSSSNESSSVPLAISVAVGISAVGAGGCAYALKVRKRKLHLIGCNE